MDAQAYLAAVTLNSTLLARAAGAADLADPVPTCSEWSVADLLGHVGRVHRRVAGIVATGAQERPDGFPPGPGDDDDLRHWYEAGSRELLDTLAGADLDRPVWNWAADRPAPVAFWTRRMTHETIVHRADAESAVGRCTPVEPPQLAADGLDELFELLAVRSRLRGPFDIAGSLHFHTLDVPGEWVVEAEAGLLTVRREHAKADVAVRGGASDLLLAAYNRRPVDGLEVLGDAALFERWRDAVHF